MVGWWNLEVYRLHLFLTNLQVKTQMNHWLRFVVVIALLHSTWWASVVWVWIWLRHLAQEDIETAQRWRHVRYFVWTFSLSVRHKIESCPIPQRFTTRGPVLSSLIRLLPPALWYIHPKSNQLSTIVEGYIFDPSCFQTDMVTWANANAQQRAWTPCLRATLSLDGMPEIRHYRISIVRCHKLCFQYFTDFPDKKLLISSKLEATCCATTWNRGCGNLSVVNL